MQDMDGQLVMANSWNFLSLRSFSLLFFLCSPGAPDNHVIQSTEYKWRGAGCRHVQCRVRISLVE
jgi:hypothetical protein